MKFFWQLEQLKFNSSHAWHINHLILGITLNSENGFGSLLMTKWEKDGKYEDLKRALTGVLRAWKKKTFKQIYHMNIKIQFLIFTILTSVFLASKSRLLIYYSNLSILFISHFCLFI